MRSLTLCLSLLAVPALAQSKPTLVDAPLDLRVPMPAAKAKAAQDDFRRLLAMRPDLLVPAGSAWRTATAALKRQDCDVRDECLKQLALNAEALYALFASVERNAAGTELTATGRVVNQDGRLVRPPVSATVSAASKTPVQDALKALLLKLDLGGLPPVLTPEPKVEPTPPVVAEPVLVPPPPPPEQQPQQPVVVTGASPSAARIVAGVTLGVGLAAAVTSAVFGILSASQRAGLPGDGRFVSDAQAEQQQRVDTFASVSLGTGIGAGALLVTSLVLFTTSSPVAVAVVPTRGGASFSLAGHF